MWIIELVSLLPSSYEPIIISWLISCNDREIMKSEKSSNLFWLHWFYCGIHFYWPHDIMLYYGKTAGNLHPIALLLYMIHPYTAIKLENLLQSGYRKIKQYCVSVVFTPSMMIQSHFFIFLKAKHVAEMATTKTKKGNFTEFLLPVNRTTFLKFLNS